MLAVNQVASTALLVIVPETAVLGRITPKWSESCSLRISEYQTAAWVLEKKILLKKRALIKKI